MKVLFTAFFNKWTADGKYGLTQLYNTQADDKAVFPYATMTLIGDVADWTFTETSEDCLIDIHLFDDDPLCGDILDAATALQAAFDFFDLIVVGYTTISLERVFSNFTQVEKVWQYLVT